MTEARLDQLERLIREGFQQTDQRLAGMGQHLEQTNQRLAGMDEHLEQTDQRLAGIDQRLAGIDERFNGMDRRLDNLQNYILDFRTEVIQQFARLESRLDMMSVTVLSLDSRVPALTKAVFDLQTRFEKLVRPAA
jgi:chromosome segregation ATPase